MEGIKFVNLTPHEIRIVGEDGRVKFAIPPSGRVARVKTEQKVVGYLNGIPVVKTEFGEVVVVDENENEENPWDFYAVYHNCDNCTLTKCLDNIVNCPRQKPEKYFIVSSLVAQALKGRRDVIAPDTSPQGVVRDENGNIIGVKRFQRW